MVVEMRAYVFCDFWALLIGLEIWLLWVRTCFEVEGR